VGEIFMPIFDKLPYSLRSQGDKAHDKLPPKLNQKELKIPNLV
jgi:hypothetical protein